MAAGHEPAQADVEDEAALDDLDHGAGDDTVLLLDLLDRAPGALVLRALLGQDQPALLVLLLQDQGLDVLAGLDHLMGVDVMLDRQLAGGDDAFGLVPDVEQDLVPVDLDDGALDYVAVVEVLDGLVDRGEEGLFGPDVVDRDLGGRVGLSAARHVGVGSGGQMVGGWDAHARLSPPHGPTGLSDLPGRPDQPRLASTAIRDCAWPWRTAPVHSAAFRI